jgi:sugar phosphate isomerase/epimerase
MDYINDRLYISTIASDGCVLAETYGLGLEIAEFCTASNMDMDFAYFDVIVRNKMQSADKLIFHAPFNELYPAAIDPLAVDLARRRYRQALDLAQRYNITRMVVHSGYIPVIYHEIWMMERSIAFWKAYLAACPTGMDILLENVMEDSPELLIDIVRGVDDPRFRLCLDIGHAHMSTSRMSILDWIDRDAPYLSHVHIHNNNGSADLHAPLGEGTAPIAQILSKIIRLCPQASFTIENLTAGPSIIWLAERGFLAEPASRTHTN